MTSRKPIIWLAVFAALTLPVTVPAAEIKIGAGAAPTENVLKPVKDAVEKATGVRPPLPPHLADLFQRDERCTVLANDLKTVQAFVAAHGNRGKPL